MQAIEIIDLTKTYIKTKALANFNLSVKEGSITGFIGGNGAGKTTTINILANTLKKDSGAVKILDEEIKAGDWKYKSNVGFVLEKPKYLEYLTGKEFLEFVGTMYKIEPKISKKRIEELMEIFELKDKQNKLIKTYSKGMKQKISLAAALINEPQLLILDEPFEGLDPIARKKTKNILSQMRENGKTIFISSHSLLEVEDFCDEVAIINKGKIVYQSAIKDIRNKIKNELTRETYNSLEEIFIDLTTEEEKKSNNTLSWL